MSGRTKTRVALGKSAGKDTLAGSMQITFWGVRGSYPVPGAATVRYGGQTSCVEARSAQGNCLIIDAGTGLRALGNKLMREATGPQTYDVLLSHVHWDHI